MYSWIRIILHIFLLIFAKTFSLFLYIRILITYFYSRMHKRNNRFVFSIVLFSTITQGSSSAIKCRNGFISTEEHKGLCCKPTECLSGNYVQPCQSNYSEDICKSCKPGTVLEDNTTSYFITKCTLIECPNGTIPQSKRSTEFCSKYCACDVKKGYCGYDACKCEKKKCGYKEQLTQFCGCVPDQRVIKPSIASVAAIFHMTEKMSFSTFTTNEGTTSQITTPSTTSHSVTTITILSNHRVPHISEGMVSLISIFIFCAIVLSVGGIIIYKCRKRCPTVIHNNHNITVKGKSVTAAIGESSKIISRQRENNDDAETSEESSMKEFDGFV